MTLCQRSIYISLGLTAVSCSHIEMPIENDARCEAEVLPGDIVITEVMANPDGDDNGKEYIEIYNTTETTLQLRGLVIENAANNGSKPRQHTMSDAVMAPNQYLVMINAISDSHAGDIEHQYSGNLGAISNSGGQLALRCNGITIDHLLHSQTRSGHSLGLDGSAEPDYQINDNTQQLCEATVEFAPGAFGSPGARNEHCLRTDRTTCIDSGIRRAVINPDIGELVFSEIMADPDVVGDEVGEWFEIVATASFDLNGIVAGKNSPIRLLEISDDVCISTRVGERFLFARTMDPALNGGLPDPDFSFNFSLPNSGTNTSLYIGIDDHVIDQVRWQQTRAGISTALAPSHTHAKANDDLAHWCSGSTIYGDGDRGSPADNNLPCSRQRMCMDNGRLRPIVPPHPNNVTITEIMANPAEPITDANGEWFEIEFTHTADLNGLQLGKIQRPITPLTTIDSIECVSVEAGSFVLFARDTAPRTNGGLPTDNIYRISFGLTNSGDSLFVAHSEQILDAVTYSRSTPGSSTQIMRTTRCDGLLPYGNGENRGSPGRKNENCSQR